MGTSDPVKLILENVSDELHGQFVHELSLAVKDVCAFASDPHQVGQRAAFLAQLIRSWHLTVALQANPSWVEAVQNADNEIVDESQLGNLEDFRRLVRT